MLSLCWKSPHPSPNTGQMSSSKSICNAAAVKEAPSNAERLLCAQGQRAPKLAPSTPCRVHSFFILSLFFCSLVCTTLRVVRKFPRKSSRNVKASTQTCHSLHSLCLDNPKSVIALYSCQKCPQNKKGRRNVSPRHIQD